MVSDQLWMPWSDTLGRYAPTWPSYGEAVPLSDCKMLNRTDAHVKDWRPVRIPTPRQIEATAKLLAALKLILESTDRDAIGQFESDAAYAAIADAEGDTT